MIHTGTYRGEQIEICFACKIEKTDYGVPGSPKVDELVDVEVTSVSILGVEIDPATLPPALFGEITHLADEVGEWS
jgi:hypothetical protein